MRKIIILPFLALIKIYRLLISPWLPFACRYQPTCSEYAREAFERYGLIKGTYLALLRILRCHPLGGSGYNPVPKEKEASKHAERPVSNNKCCGSTSQCR